MFQIDDDKELVPLRRYWIVENNIEWPKFEKKISNSWFDFCFNLFLGLFFGKLFCTTYIIFKSNQNKKNFGGNFPWFQSPLSSSLLLIKNSAKIKGQGQDNFLKKISISIYININELKLRDTLRLLHDLCHMIYVHGALWPSNRQSSYVS